MVGWEAESYTKAGEERFGPHLRGKPWQRGPTGLALSSWAQHHFAHPRPTSQVCPLTPNSHLIPPASTPVGSTQPGKTPPKWSSPGPLSAPSLPPRWAISKGRTKGRLQDQVGRTGVPGSLPPSLQPSISSICLRVGSI